MGYTQKVKEYYEENPELLSEKNFNVIANLLKVPYDIVRKVAKELRENLKGQVASKGKITPVEGVLTKAKTWQLPNGEWRESLTFNIDYDDKWAKFKEDFLGDIKKVGSLDAPKTKFTEKSGVCLEISLPDLHIGKGDTQELVDKFVGSCLALLKKAEMYNIERILLPIGNDGLNSEGRRYSTTGGTPQRDSIDWQESFRVYWVTLMAVIKEFAKVYPVDVIVVPGNHDRERMFYVGDVLTAYFTDYPDVVIMNSGEYRHYYEYGINMLMFTHGDKEKLVDLPLIMATEQPEMFGRTKVREVHMGHRHREMVNEFRGVKTRFLPSICHTDNWHKMMGFDHQKAAQAFVWSKTQGLDGYFQINHF